MKEHIKRISILIFSICLIGILIYTEQKSERNDKTISLYFKVGNEVIKTWENEGTYFLFLPSYAAEERIVLTPYSPEFYVVKQGRYISKNENISDIIKNQKVECQLAKSGKQFQLCIMQSENIPAMFIDINNNSLEELKADKEHEVSGKMRVIDPNNSIEEIHAFKVMKARGNTSFTGFEKKSYSLILSEKESILGLPAGEGYALISNASDLSLIRNDIVRSMEVALELPFSHVGKFVDLYVNGEYEGNYYLCDKLEVGPERIDINNMETLMDLIYSVRNYESVEIYENENAKARKFQISPKDISGGYLIEREYLNRFQLEFSDIESAFVTDAKECFVVKNPNYCSVEQVEYIRQFINEAEKAILSSDGKNWENGKYYWEYIDVDSFVKKYLAEEVSKNYDAGVTSSFFYKNSDVKNGKLIAAPGWDYDMCFGNYLEWMEEFSADPTGVSKLSFNANHSPWYAKLYEKPEFYELIEQNYWKSVEPFLQELLEDKIDDYENMLKASANMNAIRWFEELNENHLYEDRKEIYKKLKSFILERKTYLDEAWSLEKTQES